MDDAAEGIGAPGGRVGATSDDGRLDGPLRGRQQFELRQRTGCRFRARHVDLGLLRREPPAHGRIAGQVDPLLDPDRGRDRQLVGLASGVGLALDAHAVTVEAQTFRTAHHRTPERVRDPDPDLEAAGVGRLVAEQDQVERTAFGLGFDDGVSERAGGALRVPLVVADVEQDGTVRPDAHGIPELLLGRGRAERQHGHLATVLLDELDGSLDGALLVRAGREAQVGGVDLAPVGRDVDLRAGCGHPLHADEDPHDFIRASVGSNGPCSPTTSTGKVSLKYMTSSRVPGRASSRGRYAMSTCLPTEGQ